MKHPKKNQLVVIKNRKATFNYEIIGEYIAGIVLKGFEVKAIKEGKANLVDAYCYFREGELFTKGLNVGITEKNQLEKRAVTYKLLLHKLELNRLKKAKKEKGYTIIPLQLFCNERQLLKLVIGLARGKKQHDKRAAIKKKQLKRTIEKATKNNDFS